MLVVIQQCHHIKISVVSPLSVKIALLTFKNIKFSCDVLLLQNLRRSTEPRNGLENLASLYMEKPTYPCR